MLLDPPYEKEVAYCDGCQLEIYPGDEMLEFEGGIITHNDFDCVKDALGAREKTGAQYQKEREIDEKERLAS